MGSPQCTFAIGDDSMPLPDFAIVARDYDERRHPDRALLLVEISDSTLRKDRRVKSPLYAESGAPEYWIVNIPDRCVEVHRDRSPSGWGQVDRVGEDGSITLVAFPDVRIDVRAVLPPR